MYYSLKGTITLVTTSGVVVDVHDISYFVLVSHPEDYTVGEEKLLYIHFVVREDEQYFVGFPNLEEKALFLMLIRVKGIGPKTALNALSATRPTLLSEAILTSNVSYLKKLPGIGAKAASQMILDLKGELAHLEPTGAKMTDNMSEAKEGLRAFGFKVSEIDAVFKKIDGHQSTEVIMKQALQMLRK